MKEIGFKARKMDQVITFLQMGMFMRENFKMEIDKEKEVIPGLTKAIIRENGWPIK